MPQEQESGNLNNNPALPGGLYLPQELDARLFYLQLKALVARLRFDQRGAQLEGLHVLGSEPARCRRRRMAAI